MPLNIKLYNDYGQTTYEAVPINKIDRAIDLGQVIDTSKKVLVDYERNSIRRTRTAWVKPANLELVERVAIPQNFAGLEAVSVPTRLEYQYFTITDVDEDIDGVTITCQHVFYELLNNQTTWEPDAATLYSGAAALRGIMNNIVSPETRFSVASDCTDTLKGEELDYSRKNIVEALLNPENGLCKRYGLSLIRDNWNFYCLKNVGYDRGFVVESGKNLLGVERVENIENVITRVAPIAKDKDGNVIWLDGTRYIDSTHINDYPSPRSEVYDTGLQIGKDGVTAQNVQQKMREAAQKRFTDDKVDLPEVTMDIQFISVGDTEEYKQYRDLDKVYLYDIVTIHDTKRGYDYTAQVISVTHDVLTGSLISIRIGTLNNWDGTRKIASWQVPEVDGKNIRLQSIYLGALAPGAVGAGNLGDGVVTARSIAAKTITAENMAAGSLTAREIAAGAITAEKIDADDVDAINATLGTADIARAQVETADINFLRVKDLNASSAFFRQAIMDEGVGGEIFISRLRVAYAQMVAATIGDLVIKATDGNYYQIDVATDGTVTGTQVQVSQEEIDSGHTTGGRTIIESDIVAENLSTSNIYATHALIGEITANTINVDSLFAREATIDKINTMDLMSNTYIKLAVGDRTGHTGSLTDEVSGLNDRISELGYGTVYMQPNEPSHAELVQGDIWIQSQQYSTWGQVKDNYTWRNIKDNGSWQSLGGIPKMFVWDGSKWQEMYDAAINEQIETEIEQLKDQITLRATKAEVTLLGDQVSANQAQIQINSDAIANEVSRATAAEGGLIAKTETYQTADSIVNAAKSYADGQLESYSTTTQTADQIAQYVTNNAYKQVSGITITSAGIEITGSQYVKIGTSGKLIVTSGNFTLDANGNGTIGGWAFTSNRLSSGSGTGYVAMDSSTSSNYAIWAGAEAAASAPFRVTRTGQVYLTKLYTVNEQGGASSVDLTSYPLWKLYYKTIKSVDDTTGVVTLSDGTTFNSARSVTLSGSWSGGILNVTASNGKTYSVALRQGVTDWNNGAADIYINDAAGGITSTYFQAHVTLANSGSWGSGSNANYYNGTITDTVSNKTALTYSVNATGRYNAGVTYGKDTYGYVSSATLTPGTYASDYKSRAVNVKALTPAGEDYGWDQDVDVDTSGAYNAGWNDARGKVALPGAGTGTSFTVKVPSATVGDQDTATFTIANSSSTPSASGYANVSYGGNVVGRVNIGGWYSSGVTAGQNAVTVSGSWKDATYTAKTSTNKTASTTITGVSLNGVAKRGSGTKDLTQSVIVKAGSTNVLTTNITVDGSLRYADGETAGKAAIGISGSWSGTKFTATTSGKATESTVATTLSSSGGWGTGDNVNKYTLNVKATNPSGGSSTPLTATVDATGRYNAGVTYGKNTYGFVNNCTAYANYYSSDWLTLYVRVQATTPAGGDTGWDQDIGVDASGAYWAGYDAGWYNARAMMTRDGNVIYGPPASRDGAAVEMYKVTVDVVLRDVSVARTEADATAYVNGTGVAWQTRRIIH